MAIAIAIETPLQDEVRALIADLNDAMNAQEPDTPEEFKFRMTAEEMAGPETTLWVARREGRAVGIGALLRHPDGLGEVKRMYVRPDQQGQGVAGRIIEAIDADPGEGFSASNHGLQNPAWAAASWCDSPRTVLATMSGPSMTTVAQSYPEAATNPLRSGGFRMTTPPRGSRCRTFTGHSLKVHVRRQCSPFTEHPTTDDSQPHCMEAHQR